MFHIITKQRKMYVNSDGSCGISAEKQFGLKVDEYYEIYNINIIILNNNDIILLYREVPPESHLISARFLKTIIL